MSIIYIDNIIFNDEPLIRQIQYKTTFFFLILNVISLISGLIFIIFYSKVLSYQNTQNDLTLILIIITTSFSLAQSSLLASLHFLHPSPNLITKLNVLFSPLLIFSLFLWCVCLTHNIYTLYYKNRKNLNKRITLYKYSLFIAIAITYVFVLFGRNKTCEENSEGFLNKKCSLMCYSKEFLVLFNFCCCVMFVYILRGLFYIMKANNNSFISLNEENLRDVKVKNMMDSLIFRNLLLIWYFVVCFIPITIQVILRMCFDIEGAENYYFTYIGFVLVSFYGCFVSLVQLMDPAIRNYICLLWGVGGVFITNTNSTDDLLDRVAVIGNISEEESVSSEDEMRYNIDNRDKHQNQQEDSHCDNKCSDNASRIEMIDMIGNQNINTNNNNNITCNLCNNKNENELLHYNDDIINDDENSFANISNTSNNNLNSNNKENGNDYVYHRKSKHSNSQKLKENNYKDSVQVNENHSSLPFNHHCILDDKISNQNDTHSSLNPSLCKSDKYIPPQPQQNPMSIRHVKTISKNRSLSKHGLTRTTRTIIRNYRKVYTKFILNENTVDFNLVNYHLDLADNLLRMLAISISINESRRYDNSDYYFKYDSSILPWKEDKFYKEKTPWKAYTQETIPENFPAKTDNRFRGVNFKIKSICPFVFHHLRLIDKISIDELIQSLDPIKNLSLCNELGVSGGRGDNSISYTWDKKMIIKTITRQEKRLFKNKMLRKFHSRMRDTKSLLCRIYGLFKIEINNKGSIHVLLQKNMCALPNETHLLTFDLKGSTVDRQCISSKDANELSQEALMEKYKNKVLKDKDLSILNIKFNLSSSDGRNLLTCIEKDSKFLQGYNITDYSLLVFVHKYQKEDISNNLGNLRIMRSVDYKYIFNFSIIDFLGTFNLKKKSEKVAKELVAFLKKMKDTNFSVMDPINYGWRFIKYSQTIITVETEDDK